MLDRIEKDKIRTRTRVNRRKRVCGKIMVEEVDCSRVYKLIKFAQLKWCVLKKTKYS